MAEYVSTEAVAEIIQHAKTRRDAISELSMLPAADVRPVVRGEWVRENNDPFADTFHCSNCLNSPLCIYDVVLSDFCPNCGADMREAK